MRRLLLGIICLIGLSPAGFGATAAPKPVTELSVRDAIILGVVEGVTEFLPVSSTGHLIVATHLLGLESDAPLAGRDGQPLWFKKASRRHPAGVALTTKLAADAFTIVIQFGAIAAVAVLYWRQLQSMVNGLLGRDPAGRRLLRNILIAFMPAAILGLALGGLIDTYLFSIGAVIAAQVAGAFFILWAERYRRRRAAQTPIAQLIELTPREALTIGLLQCAALWPGTSRSMMTIVGGYLAGLDPRQSAEFSFLLGFVTLTAATVYKSYLSGAAMIQVFGWPHVLLGCAVAAVTAALAVRLFVTWLTRHGMGAFAWYRLAFAAVMAMVFWW
ncbi:MAG: undecaprenyl-diphosphate phosphatase [Opitutaceae bacterium]